MLDQKYLLELFEYKDGELYWKISPSNNTAIGNKAGTTKAKYTMIGINGTRYYKVYCEAANRYHGEFANAG